MIRYMLLAAVLFTAVPTDEECHKAYRIDIRNPDYQPLPEILRRCLTKDQLS